jgi:uncharacterized membrane protein YhfC
MVGNKRGVDDMKTEFRFDAKTFVTLYTLRARSRWQMQALQLCEMSARGAKFAQSMRVCMRCTHKKTLIICYQLNLHDLALCVILSHVLTRPCTVRCSLGMSGQSGISGGQSCRKGHKR